jgi:hypothetical protein
VVARGARPRHCPASTARMGQEVKVTSVVEATRSGSSPSACSATRATTAPGCRPGRTCRGRRVGGRRRAPGQRAARGRAHAHLRQHAADRDPAHPPLTQQLGQRRVREPVAGWTCARPSRRRAPAPSRTCPRLVDLPERAVVLQLHDQGTGVGRPSHQRRHPRHQPLSPDHRCRPGQQPALHVHHGQRLHRLDGRPGHRPATRIATRTSSSNGPGPSASRRPASNAGSVGTAPGDSADCTLPSIRSYGCVSV